MKKYIYHIITVFAALLVANSAWGQDNGTLPVPDELNEDLKTGTYKLDKDYKPSSERRWRVSSGRNVTVDLNGHTIDGVNIGRTIFNISDGTLTIIDSKGGGVIKNSKKSCFYVAPSSGKKSTLNLKGGTIENCAPSDGCGGAMDIQPNGTVNMSGGLITKCKGTSGAAVYVTGGTFNMTGGEIKGNKVNAYTNWTPPTGAEDIPTSTNTDGTKGGGIYVEKGTCTVSGGTISGNVAHSGGGVFVTSGATFSFTGGTIEGNYAVSKLGAGTGNGGGIYIESANSNCTINGGTIKNNRATRYGGGININGSTMTIPNCTISGNLASSGGGISMETSGSTLNLQGCTVKENIAKISTNDPNGTGEGGGGGIFLVDGTLKMSGTNNIQTNHSYELGGGVYLKKGTVNISGGTSTFTKNDAEISGGAIYLADGNITVATGATLTVGSKSNGNTATTEGGGIYCAGTITVNGTTNIKYNSATNGGGIYCKKAISLKGTSTIDYNSATEKGGGIYCAAQVDVTGQSQMSHNSATDGGAAYVTGKNLNLAECTAESNSSTHYGGAFYVVNGNITFSGAATISNNTAVQRGGAAYVDKGAITTATGNLKTILSNNTVTGVEDGTDNYSGGAFYLKGTDDTKAYLYLQGKTEMTSNSAVTNGGAIALNKGNVKITGAETIFSSNTAEKGGAVYVSNGNFETDNTSTVTTLTQNSSTDNGGAVYVTGGNFTTQGSISIRDNYANGNGGAIYVTGGKVTMAKPTVTGNGKNAGAAVTKNGGAIYVTGSGASFTTSGTCNISSNAAKKSGGAVYVDGGTLTTTASTVTIEDNYASTNGGAFYVTGGSVKMNKANINRNGKNGDTVTATNGGAIYVTGDGAGFEATGTAKFNSNAAKTNGGAVYVEGGSLTLAANEIISNLAKNDGGAFYVTGGTVSMSGKSDMTGNSATNYGGVAYVNEGSITTAAGDVVTSLSENSARSGGGFYVNGTASKRGSVSLQGKTNLTDNSVSENGGAVCVNYGDLTILKDASIDNNSAKHGGAFYVTNGNITTSTGSISNNSADEEEGNGGAFYVNNGVVTLGAVQMGSNKAFNGGAIALYNGTFALDNASQIQENTATYGGGLYVNNTGSKISISCTGGSFLKNTAQLGGGIYASGDIELTFAANVEENLAQNGGGLYLDNGVDMLFGNGLIVKNQAKVAENVRSANSGVGGGIYLAKGTLSFSERQNLGIYNNVASFEAADIYSSGTETTVNLPYVKDMNLKGFDVPGSELYWVSDWNAEDVANKKYGRYEMALRNLNINIEDMIEPFTNAQIQDGYKTITAETCLDLGYDLVFVNLYTAGLLLGDNSTLNVSYSKNGDGTNPIVYRTLLLSGGEDNIKIVGLPSGDWMFTPSGWASKYEDRVAVNPSNEDVYYITSSEDNSLEPKYINIKRIAGQNTDIDQVKNQDITFTYTMKENVKNAVTFEFKKVNKMIPGGATTTQN